MPMTAKELDLPQILEELKAGDRYGTKDALAKAIGISPSRLGRVMKGGKESLDVINCLRLAKISGLPIDHILHAAGKSEVANLIRELYGVAPIRPPKDAFLTALSDEGRQALQVLMREMRKLDTPKKRR